MLESIQLSDYQPDEFKELYVCALILMAQDSSIQDAHSRVETLREGLEFEVEVIPNREETH
ncbi:hypothetical protein [Isorropodon fossajaponicum symbiont]|uniref:hypothetical protein n=1 Tax=Isorropodon fossajaponicum symbiont TaxID=883811 RepID=UPI0019167C9A|nr:hypothetical protein [Isorropodon fossajaponicum symbiont]